MGDGRRAYAMWVAVPAHSDSVGRPPGFRTDDMEALARGQPTLLSLSGTGNGIDGLPKPYTRAGLTTVHAGADAATYFHVAAGNPASPT
jgi:hypothetical protein